MMLTLLGEYAMTLKKILFISAIVAALTGCYASKPKDAAVDVKPVSALEGRWEGIGNEPSWRIVIEGQGLEFTEPGKYEDYKTTWEKTVEGDNTVLKAPNHNLEISFTKKACKDTMSGKPFEYQVHVQWAQRTLKGCGTVTL